MTKLIFLLSILLFSSSSVMAVNVEKSQQEKENEVLDFNSIKKVIKNDQLESIVKKKVTQKIQSKVRKENLSINRYNVPAENNFWTFMSEMWLVKNAQLLKWDFKKPDYGLLKSFRDFLEKMGHYEVEFKILLVNTPNVTHFSLPSDRGEAIFILSVPFIRTLDLSKLEISILLYEDFQRNQIGYFKDNIRDKALDKILGTNFFGEKKVDLKVFKDALKKYDDLIYDKGFNFQQQFEVTKRMGAMLKSDLRMWNAYFQLIKKIDNLVKSNLLYSKYNKIYPSPELQLNWLKPKTKKI